MIAHEVRLAVWCIAASCSGVACGTTGPTIVADYAVDASGRPAIVHSDTRLYWPQGESSGLILNAEVCDSRVYLFAPSAKRVRVAELATGRVEGQIGRPGSGPADLRRPVSIGVDCRNRRLYFIEGPGGILVFDLDSGAYLRTFSHPFEFRPSTGSPVSTSDDGTRLTVAGLWPVEKDGFDRQRRSRMYVDTKLGLELSLAGGTTAPIMAALEPGCDADITACLRVDVQPLNGAGGWVVAQGGSTYIGVLSPGRELIRTIDARSREFVRDGSPPGATTEAQMKWAETNSTIWGVYALGDLIAVIHARHATKNWKRGQTVQFDVFMNLFSVEGDRLVSDIRLPDLPVGHDGEHVFVIAYGPAGRRAKASDVRLQRIRVRPGLDGFASGT